MSSVRGQTFSAPRRHPEARRKYGMGGFRSQGAFQHSILAGSFGATSLPLLIWLWSDRSTNESQSWEYGGDGNDGNVPFIYNPWKRCAGIFALCMWPLRRQMRTDTLWAGRNIDRVTPDHERSGLVPTASTLDMTGSSESYHRYQLSLTLSSGISVIGGS